MVKIQATYIKSSIFLNGSFCKTRMTRFTRSPTIVRRRQSYLTTILTEGGRTYVTFSQNASARYAV